jgi:hypothetical protein
MTARQKLPGVAAPSTALVSRRNEPGVEIATADRALVHLAGA